MADHEHNNDGLCIHTTSPIIRMWNWQQYPDQVACAAPCTMIEGDRVVPIPPHFHLDPFNTHLMQPDDMVFKNNDGVFGILTVRKMDGHFGVYLQ